MQEEWMQLEEFPDYAVSNYGYVQNTARGRSISRSAVQYGMMTVAMMLDGRQYRRSIATLVAQAFLPPPPREDFNTPIHLDGDRKNCRADNLAWRPRWFAIAYHQEKRSTYYDKWTRDFRLEQTGEVFDNIRVPSQKYGLLERDIHLSLVNGGYAAPHGYSFEFI